MICENNSKDGVDAALRNSYDLNGSLTSSQNTSWSARYRYDGLGRVISVLYDGGIQKKYSYDLADRVTSMVVLQGSATEMNLSYQYDKAGKLSAVVSGGVRTDYTYDAAGQLIKETNGLTGTTNRYQYYPTGTLKSLDTMNGPNLINHFEYKYDLKGNQIQKDENGSVTSYIYDPLSRLKTAVLPDDMIQNYSYDDLGNIERLAEIQGNNISESWYSYDYNAHSIARHEKDLSKTISGCAGVYIIRINDDA